MLITVDNVTSINRRTVISYSKIRVFKDYIWRLGDLQGICVLGKIANVARGRVKSDVVYEDIVGVLDTHMSSGSVHDTKAAKGRIIGRHKDSRRSSVIEGIVPKSPR